MTRHPLADRPSPSFAAALASSTLALGALALAPAAARAQAATPTVDAEAVAACTALTERGARLACYDRLHGRVDPASPVAATTAPLAVTAAADTPARIDSHLGTRWDLDGQGSTLFTVRPYRPVYLLPGTWTSHINLRPSSPSPDHSVTEDQPLKSVEAKYQLSFKSKLGENLLGTPLALWGAYTQSSRWQVYDGALSRPFRETNYEPELILAAPLDVTMGGWRLRLGSLSLNHQSNGRSLPLSRSWNRIIGTLAAERGEWVAELRPWVRIQEAAAEDDNPDIEDFIGRGELRLSRYWGGHALLLNLRHSLRGGERSRGSAEMNWVFPLRGELHGFLQVFSGHGESMIDYNISQTRLGLGVTIAGWR